MDTNIVAGYIRVSTAVQVEEGESLETQKAQIEQFVAQRGWQLYKIYADEGLSGAKIDFRTQFQQMIADAKAGKFSIIVFSRLSRFSRSLRDYVNIKEELKQAGIKLISIKENIDTTTHTGRLMEQLIVSIAEYEREIIEEQLKENKMARWRDNRIFLGKVPFGYRWNKEKKQLEIEQHEADIFRRIVTMYTEQGLSFRDIANKLTLEGVRGQSGATFSSAVISYMLKNSIYYGHYVVNQTIYKAGRRGAGTLRSKERKPISEAIIFNSPPLIPKATWDKIQATTKFRKIKIKRATDLSLSFFLRDSLKCGRCGGKMNARIGSKRADGTHKRYYACYWASTLKKNIEGNHQKCSLPSIPAEKVENAVWADILVLFALNPDQSYKKLLNSENIAQQLTDVQQKIKNVQDELAIKKRAKERLYKMLENDNFDEAEVHSRIIDNQNQILSIQGTMATYRQQLQEIEDLSRKQEEIRKFIVDNKDGFELLVKDISELSLLDKKALVEAMLDGPVEVDYQDDSEDEGPGGVSTSFHLHINTEILRRFKDERKLTQLNQNDVHYFAALISQRSARNNKDPFCSRKDGEGCVADDNTALQVASPYHFGRGAGGWRFIPPARRNITCS